MTSSVSAQTQLGVGQSPAAVTDWFQQQLIAALSDPLFNLPKVFLTYMADYIATSGLSIPIGQVLGFSQFTVQQATPIITSETTTSATFDDLATVGPEITGLADGQYVILFGAALSASAGDNAIMGIKINATEATTADPTVQTNATTLTSGATAMVKTLSNNGNNTLTARYESTGTGTFAVRWLIALKFANA